MMPDEILNLDAYERFVNPAWSNIVRLSGLDIRPERATGSRLFMTDGREFLDFVTGYGAMPLGHNPPDLLNLLSSDLRDGLPNLNPLGRSEQAGELAGRLIRLAGINDGKVYFGSAGTDAVDAALKFAMVHTGRRGLLSIAGGFHGLSLSATSLAGSDFWRRGLPAPPGEFRQTELNDTDSIELALETGNIAAIILEPVQGTAGSNAWTKDALQRVAALCEKHGSVLIFDEILCGVARSGHWFAYQALDVPAPHIVTISKGLTGGILPLSAVLMRDSIYQSVFGRTSAAKIHGSTFSCNRLSMRCGTHVLSLLEDAGICAHVRVQGERLQLGVKQCGRDFGFTCDGVGLLLSIRAMPDALRRYGGGAALQLWQALLERNVMTIPAAHDPVSIRLLPPLNVGAEEIEIFLNRLREAFRDLS